MKHVMVDLETTGLRPDRNSFIQIAGVEFDPVDRSVSEDMFNRCLVQPENRPPDYDTMVNFWGKNPDIFNGICARAEPVETVLTDFVRWVGYEGDSILWAKPSHFEHPWLESYFADYRIPNPFHYRNSTDLYSFMKGMFGVYHTDDLPEDVMSIQIKGNAHDAIYDALHQVEMLFAALDLKEGAKA